MYEAMLYPEAKFLFEVNGLGGPMAPYRFYATPDPVGQVADFYRQGLPEFTVELDEIEYGHRHLMLARTESVLDRLGQVDDPMDLPRRSRELEGTLMGVEVVHSSDDSSISRLRIARYGYQRGDEIPEDSVVIVLEYFKNIYG